MNNKEFRTTQMGAGYSDVSYWREKETGRWKKTLSDYSREFFESSLRIGMKIIKGTFLIGGLIGGVYLLGESTGVKQDNFGENVGKNIELICKKTSEPIYSEPESNISLWNLDGKGKYGEIDVEAVTTYENPRNVLWYNPDYVGEMKKRGWIFNKDSKEFNFSEKFHSNKVVNEQVFYQALRNSKNK